MIRGMHVRREKCNGMSPCRHKPKHPSATYRRFPFPCNTSKMPLVKTYVPTSNCLQSMQRNVLYHTCTNDSGRDLAGSAYAITL